MDLFALIQTLQGVPQTQQDINVLAQAARDYQSPATQAQIQSFTTKAETAAIIMLLLQTVSTAAAVGILLVQLKNSRKR